MGTSSFRGREAKRLGWERLLESVWGFPDSSLLKMIGKIAEAVRSAGFFPPSDKGGLSLGQISCHTSLKHITIRTGGILMECLTGCAAFRLEFTRTVIIRSVTCCRAGPRLDAGAVSYVWRCGQKPEQLTSLGVNAATPKHLRFLFSSPYQRPLTSFQPCVWPCNLIMPSGWHFNEIFRFYNVLFFGSFFFGSFIDTLQFKRLLLTRPQRLRKNKTQLFQFLVSKHVWKIAFHKELSDRNYTPLITLRLC